MTNDPTPALDSSADLKSALLQALRLRVENEAVILLKHVDYLASINKRAIARVEALEVELAEVRAELEDANDHKPDTLNAAAIVYDLEARGLWTVKPDDVPTRDYARDALSKVLDGVDAVFSRVADVGGPVEVPAGLVADADGWYPHDGTTWPACGPGDAIVFEDISGRLIRGTANELGWLHENDDRDIVRWRYADGRDVRDVRGGGE